MLRNRTPLLPAANAASNFVNRVDAELLAVPDEGRLAAYPRLIPFSVALRTLISPAAASRPRASSGVPPTPLRIASIAAVPDIEAAALAGVPSGGCGDLEICWITVATSIPTVLT